VPGSNLGACSARYRHPGPDEPRGQHRLADGRMRIENLLGVGIERKTDIDLRSCRACSVNGVHAGVKVGDVQYFIADHGGPGHRRN
jgi:hypothetical protein